MPRGRALQEHLLTLLHWELLVQPVRIIHSFQAKESKVFVFILKKKCAYGCIKVEFVTKMKNCQVLLR